MLAIAAGPAAANHSWGGYHWARAANPFTVKLGDNVSTAWDSYLGAASSDWSANLHGNPVRTTVVTGSTTGRKCRATAGRVEVSDAAYGRNGWLGLAMRQRRHPCRRARSNARTVAGVSSASGTRANASRSSRREGRLNSRSFPSSGDNRLIRKWPANRPTRALPCVRSEAYP
jgi:hypothetical protein